MPHALLHAGEFVIRAEDLVCAPDLFGQIQAALLDGYHREDTRATARLLGRTGIFTDSDGRRWQLGTDRAADIELPAPPPTPIEEVSLDDGDTMTFHTPASTADIDHRFDFHPATTEEKRAEHGSVRAACRDLAHQFDRDIPPGREKALALTHLEDAMMWANAAIARNR